MRRRTLKMNVLIEGKNQKTNKQLSRLILPYTHVFGRQTPESTEIIFQIPRKEYFNPEWQSVPGLGSPQPSLHFLLHPAAHPSGWTDRNEHLIWPGRTQHSCRGSHWLLWRLLLPPPWPPTRNLSILLGHSHTPGCVCAA